MAHEPTEAPTPNLSGFGQGDAGSAFNQRMKERANQASSVPATTEPATTPAVVDRQSSPPPAPLQAPMMRAEEHESTVKPTVLSVDESVVHRFEEARKNAASHTGMILKAIEAHYKELPQLIQSRRPKPAEGALFSFRPAPGEVVSERRLPLRIRPLEAELAIIDKLVDQCRIEVDSEVHRSELVAAALDAYLPKLPKKRRRSMR